MPKIIQLDRTPSLPLDSARELVPIGESNGNTDNRAHASELSTGLSGQYREVGREVTARRTSAQEIHHPTGVSSLELQTEEKSELLPAQDRALVNSFLAKLAL